MVAVDPVLRQKLQHLAGIGIAACCSVKISGDCEGDIDHLTGPSNQARAKWVSPSVTRNFASLSDDVQALLLEYAFFNDQVYQHWGDDASFASKSESLFPLPRCDSASALSIRKSAKLNGCLCV